jgi:uncharacterized membrane protein
MKTAKKWLWILAAVSAVLVGLYPSVYLFIDRTFGLLSSKSGDLLNDIAWNIAFYVHISFAGVALLLGWTQFNPKRRQKNPALHRNLGKIYVVSALVGSVAGICIGFFATGGIVAASGFISLGLIWFATTLIAYLDIRNRKVESHKKMMVFSYAACFAGVTLRIWLPILESSIGDFTIAYRVTAWMCWVPNLIVAYLITRPVSGPNKSE